MINRFQFQESPPPASASSCPPKVVSEKNEVCLGFHESKSLCSTVREQLEFKENGGYGTDSTMLWGVIGAWWLSDKFGALRLQGRRFEPNSNRHVGTLGKSFTCSCLYNMMWCPA